MVQLRMPTAAPAEAALRLGPAVAAEAGPEAVEAAAPGARLRRNVLRRAPGTTRLDAAMSLTARRPPMVAKAALEAMPEEDGAASDGGTAVYS